jgi:hypothetical protein
MDAPHAEAETLPDRTQAKKGGEAPKVVGHRWSWLVCVASQRPSWCMPPEVERVESQKSDSEVAAGGHVTCRFGKGVVPIQKCVETLQRLGYTGAISVEHEPEHFDPTEDCKATLRLLRR